MSAILLILFGLLLLAAIFLVPVRAFHSDTEQGKYLALLFAAPFLALGFYLLVVWKFRANDGAPSGVAIIPAIAWAIGMVSALAGIGWLVRFFSLSPRHGYLVPLAFLPCFWVAHRPDHSADLARGKQRLGEASQRQRDAGGQYARSHHLLTTLHCPDRGGSFRSGCRQQVFKQSRLPELEQRMGSDLARRKQWRSPDDCPREAGPSTPFSEEFINGCRNMVSYLPVLAGDQWAKAHAGASAEECAAAAIATDSPNSRKFGESCRMVLSSLHAQQGDWWARRNFVTDGIECELHWMHSPDAAEYIAGCKKFRPDWSYVDQRQLVKQMQNLEHLVTCPDYLDAAARARTFGCAYRVNGGPMARLREGYAWASSNHPHRYAECIAHFSEMAMRAIDYVHGCMVQVQGTPLID